MVVLAELIFLSSPQKKSFHNSTWPFISVYGVCLGLLRGKHFLVSKENIFMRKATIFCSLTPKKKKS